MSDRRVDALSSGYETTEDMRVAYQALKRIPQEDRGRVLCWFCPHCYAYVGPGRNMTCDGGHHA